MAQIDLWDEGEIIAKFEKKETAQILSIYSEFIIMSDGTLKRLTCKSWVKGVKETKALKSRVIDKPVIELEDEVLM